MVPLTDLEYILAARSAESLWQNFIRRMAGLGLPHVSYYSVRILATGGDRMVDDYLFMTSYAPVLLQEIQSQGGFASVPMYRWITGNHGSESWDWMQRLRQAGRLKAAEQRMLDLFARHGHVSGYAVSLGDRVQQVRGGAIISGALGMDQPALDAIWRQHGPVVEALTGLVHLRLTTLPYDPPQHVLTLRQREVLEQIAVGRTTQEIAAVLDVTRATVEKHLRLARKALSARTTPQAILLASNRRQIFLDPGESCTLRTQDQAEAARAWRFQSFAVPVPATEVEATPDRILRRRRG